MTFETPADDDTPWMSPGSAPDGSGDGVPALLVSSDAGVGVHPLVGREIFVLGRAPEADVVIKDRSISRRHARLTVGDAFVLEALPSTNATSVWGRTLEAGERSVVPFGAAFALGNVTCVLQRVRADARTLLQASPLRKGEGFDPATVVVDPRMRHLYGMLRLIGPSPLNVVVLGETGVGKDLYARAVHANSDRAHRPFLQLNCAALPEQLLEAELFGYVKGAFTGATDTKPGLFESADGGVVFLDEIGDLPLTTQAKLLRTIESGEVRRIGALQNRRVDVRFIGATNRDLRRLCAEGKFRSDLFFRLNGMTVTLPPLRERRSEIAPLARSFCAQISARVGRSAVELSGAVVAALERHDWPGNVRELKNVVERGAILCEGESLTLAHLDMAEGEMFSIEPPATSSAARPARDRPGRPDAAGGSPLSKEISQVERARIVEALARTAGNQSEAARQLGISRHTLMKRLKAYGVARPRAKSGSG